MWKDCLFIIVILLSCSPTKAEVLYDWGTWEAWSSCSESCGKGIETRQRRCFRTSSVSQETRSSVHRRACKGPGLEFRFCNIKDCGSEVDVVGPPKVTFHDAYRIRAEQCTEFNKKSYNGKNINWKPYFRDHLDECKLYCLAAGHKFYARLKNSVKDGTPCGGRAYPNVCIKGKCQERPKGCQSLDGPCILEERKKILGVFNSTKLNLGYNLVATIPAGATNITVEELTRSRSYLALKDHNSATYHLNGHWMISLSKTFQLASTRVTYTRNGNTRRGGELITADGPLEKSLDIMVIYQRDPTIVMYSYFVTSDEYNRLKQQQSRTEEQGLHFPKDRQSYQPTEGAQGDGQAPQKTTGAQGESISFVPGQRQGPYPNSGGQGFRYPQLSTSQRQSFGDGQSEHGKQGSSYGSSWVQFGGSESEQAKQTEGPGTQYARRPFLKQQVFKPNQFGKSKLPQYQSGEQRGNRFDVSKKAGYRRSNWDSNTGQNRFGSSALHESQDRSLQSDDAKKQFYTSSQKQNDGAQRYIWKIVGFTPCSSSCAGGTQSGIVKCKDTTNGANVADSKCNLRTRLQETRRVCNLQPCPASWVPQEWKVCSKTCGEGKQVRDLMCKQVIDRDGEKVPVMIPVVECPLESRPEVIQKCFVKECPEMAKPKWIVESWGQCSVECGHGVQKRTIACKNYKNETVDNSECFLLKKPPLLKACYLGLCKADWYVYSEWSQCSRTCGTGFQSRPVVCARIEGSKLAKKHCKEKTRPENEQSCNTQNCKGIWVTSEWSKCTTECGDGLQQRVVICMKSVYGNYQETLDADCSLDDKPVVRKDCSSDCMPSWFTTHWTQCSVTCGHGVKTRHASCLNGEGKRVGGCKAWERPQQRRACYPKACPGSKPAKKKAANCKDNPPRSFKRYCHIIKRINYCRIPSYRRRCCETCTPKDSVRGHM